MRWVAEHSQVIGVAVNVALLVIWALYLHLLLRMFRRQNRSNILINRGAGEGTGSRCLVSNMSSEPIYVQAVILEVGAGGRRWSRRISDVATLGEAESATSAIARTRQGPLGKGEFIDIGTFTDLVATALQRVRDDPGAPSGIDEAEWVGVTVVGVYTSERELIGAARRFRIERDSGALHPVEALARQITNRRERRSLRDALAGD